MIEEGIRGGITAHVEVTKKTTTNNIFKIYNNLTNDC